MRYLDRVYLAFDATCAASPVEVAEVAARLGVTFPDGYAEYVAELGEGLYSGLVRVWPPRKVEANLAEMRRMIAEPFLWDQSGPLDPSRAGELVVIGNTMDGDALAFLPGRPDELYILPRHDDRTFQIGPGLDAALDWLCDSGVLTHPATARYFEPDGERSLVQRDILLPQPEVREALLGLGLHDLVGFDERAGDHEQVFEVYRKGDDGEFEEVDAEDVGIMLLVRELGGDVTASNVDGATDVTITHVEGRASPKLDRLLAFLDELEGRKRPRKRRGR